MAEPFHVDVAQLNAYLAQTHPSDPIPAPRQLLATAYNALLAAGVLKLYDRPVAPTAPLKVEADGVTLLWQRKSYHWSPDRNTAERRADRRARLPPRGGDEPGADAGAVAEASWTRARVRTRTLCGREVELARLLEAIAGRTPLVVTGAPGWARAHFWPRRPRRVRGAARHRHRGRVRAPVRRACTSCCARCCRAPTSSPAPAGGACSALGLRVGARGGFTAFAAVVSLLGLAASTARCCSRSTTPSGSTRASLDALVFVVRRLERRPGRVMFAARPGAGGAAGRRVAGARAPAARARRRRGRSSPSGRSRPLASPGAPMVALARGVPLALVELAVLGDELTRHSYALPGRGAAIVERLFG